MSASDDLQAVVQQGQDVIRKQMQENEKMFQQSIAQLSGDTSGITIDLSSFDPDLKELFGSFGKSPLHQLLFTNIQLVRRTTTLQLLVQAALAKMVGVETPATDAALHGEQPPSG